MIESGWTCTEPAPSVCTPICKDGLLIPPEICDDSTNLLIGCDSTCTGPLDGWSCAPGTPASTCSTICGDSIFVSFTESCDDGNTAGGDGCASNCVVESDWECSTDISGKSLCKPICGDGKNILTTECDTGGDPGCLVDCTGIHPCYDCSGGNSLNPMVCSFKCSDPSLSTQLTDGYMCFEGDCISLCGDGKVSATETCDDGSWDKNGCTGNCKGIRPGFSCTGGSD